MSFFLMTFLLVYGAMNAYFFRKAINAFPLRRWAIVLGIFVVAMVAAPLLVRVAENAGREEVARALALGGYGWMGVLFLFFTMSVLMDAARLVDRVVFKEGLPLSPTASFFVPFVCAGIVAGYGVIEAQRPRIETIVVTSPKVPKEAGELRIVQVSDIHLGLMVREARLEKILQIVRLVSPDLLVATGDVVDGQLAGLGSLREMLAAIQPRFGKFAVTGNHEFYARLPQSLDFLEKSGFTVLRGSSAQPVPFLRVVGVDDPVARRFGGLTADQDVLGAPVPDTFTLFLKHRPEVLAETAKQTDLQLSGHVHQGQIFPFVLATRLFYPAPTGLSRIKEGGYLYVSRGSGTWGPPLRVLAPPEVTLIRLKHGEKLSATLQR